MTRSDKLRQRAAAMLAQADAIEAGHPSVMEEQVQIALSASMGVPSSRVHWVARRLREGGLRAKRRRGRAAAPIPMSDTVIILAGLLSGYNFKEVCTATASLLASRICRETGTRPDQMLGGEQALLAVVEALVAILTVNPAATARLQVDQTDLSALIQVENNGAHWEAFFAPLRPASGDRHEIAAISDVTLMAIADLYREERP